MECTNDLAVDVISSIPKDKLAIARKSTVDDSTSLNLETSKELTYQAVVN